MMSSQRKMETLLRWRKGRRLKHTPPTQATNKRTDKEKQVIKIINIKQRDKGTPVQSTLEAWRGDSNICNNQLPSYPNNNIHNNTSYSSNNNNKSKINNKTTK